MKKYFDKQNERLVFQEEKANASFWDNQWTSEDFERELQTKKSDWLIARTTKKFIKNPSGKKVLEGGCGKGIYVRSLKNAGYEAYGVDYAEKTIEKIREAAPDLNVSLGDVRKLDFPDNFFDAYWSLGVIEHFFDGYGEISAEMKRVLKQGGYLFITFPYMSPLRKIKARLNKYSDFDPSNFEKETFYQFALNHKKVIEHFEKKGFALIQRSPLDGAKGLKDEIAILRPFLQKIYDSKSLLVRIPRTIISTLAAFFCGHVILLIFKKND